MATLTKEQEAEILAQVKKELASDGFMGYTRFNQIVPSNVSDWFFGKLAEFADTFDNGIAGGNFRNSEKIFT